MITDEDKLELTQDILSQISDMLANLPIPEHYHEGNQSNKFPISNLSSYPILSAAPTDLAQNGTIRLYQNGTVYKIYIRLNNTWVAFVPSGLAGTKIYYVSDTSGGTVNRKLTFTNGILTAET